jgi:ribonuclease BN (tRNA processing enzyme)
MGLASLPVYGPQDTDRQLAAIQYSRDPNQPESKWRVANWVDGVPVTVGPMTLLPYRVEHPVEAWGFRVTGPSYTNRRQVTFGYSGDTDLCDGLSRLARDVDLLLVEAAYQEDRDTGRGVHLTGLRAGQAAAHAGAKRVVVTHVPPWTDPADIMAELRQAYKGPAHLAKPFRAYVF